MAGAYAGRRPGLLRDAARWTVREGPVRDGRVAFEVALGEWLPDAFRERLGGVDPRSILDEVPPEAADSDPSSLPEDEVSMDRQRLHAYRAVRADLLAELEARRDRVATAVAVHDALERLVGRRGGPTDRRPAAVVDAFREWVDGASGADVPGDAGDRFTVLHVMRMRSLPVFGDGLTAAVRGWVEAEHPEAMADARVAPGG